MQNLAENRVKIGQELDEKRPKVCRFGVFSTVQNSASAAKCAASHSIIRLDDNADYSHCSRLII
jgi:hypothetical protein